MRILIWVATITVLLDQASKYLVVHVMGLANGPNIDVWPPFFNLRMAWNTGINFGLLAADNPYSRWILITVALGIALAVVIWVRGLKAGPWLYVASGLLVGGAIGNVIDRIFYGAVADFINMSCCGIRNPFSFNVADIAVFAGAIGLILLTPDKKHS